MKNFVDWDTTEIQRKGVENHCDFEAQIQLNVQQRFGLVSIIATHRGS